MSVTPSPKFLILSEFANIDLNQFIYHLEETKPRSLSIRHPTADGKMLRVYIKTPIMVVGDFCRFNGQDFLDLQLKDDTPKANEFRDFLITIDQYHIAQVESNQRLWDFDGTISNTVIARQFRQTLNFSGKNGYEYILVNFERNPKLFDQFNNRITQDQVKTGQVVRAVLELEGLRVQDGMFQTRLNLVQLKTNIKSPSTIDETEKAPDKKPESLDSAKPRRRRSRDSSPKQSTSSYSTESAKSDDLDKH